MYKDKYADYEPDFKTGMRFYNFSMDAVNSMYSKKFASDYNKILYFFARIVESQCWKLHKAVLSIDLESRKNKGNCQTLTVYLSRDNIAKKLMSVMKNMQYDQNRHIDTAYDIFYNYGTRIYFRNEHAFDANFSESESENEEESKENVSDNDENNSLYTEFDEDEEIEMSKDLRDDVKEKNEDLENDLNPNSSIDSIQEEEEETLPDNDEATNNANENSKPSFGTGTPSRKSKYESTLLFGKESDDIEFLGFVDNQK